MSFLNHRNTLPALTTATALGSLAVTLATWHNPHDAASRYGILTSSTSKTWPPLAPVDRAAITSHGVKYLGLGVVVLGLTAEGVRVRGLSAEMGRGIRRALGVVLCGASLVPVGDAWACWGWNRRAGWTNAVRGMVWVVIGGWCLAG